MEHRTGQRHAANARVRQVAAALALVAAGGLVACGAGGSASPDSVQAPTNATVTDMSRVEVPPSAPTTIADPSDGSLAVESSIGTVPGSAADPGSGADPSTEAPDTAGFVGSWTGTIEGPGGAFGAVVALELLAGRLQGTIEHPGIGCLGSTTEVSREGDSVRFETGFTADSNCIDGGTHRLTLLAPDELLYEWVAPDSNRIDSGILRRDNTETAPTVSAGADVVITPIAPGGRSVYSSDYAAEVIAVATRDRFLVDVEFAAIGRSDLRRPESSCLVSDAGRIASPIAQELTIDRAGEFRGTWTFPIIESGTWSLRYSCRSDYSLTPIATALVPSTGVSSYSSEYYATVLRVDRKAGGTVEVGFVAHGNEGSQGGLRDPGASCLVAGTRTLAPASVALMTEVSGEFYEGTLTFTEVPDTTVEFVYSCQSDYSAVRL